MDRRQVESILGGPEGDRSFSMFFGKPVPILYSLHEQEGTPSYWHYIDGTIEVWFSDSGIVTDKSWFPIVRDTLRNRERYRRAMEEAERRADEEGRRRDEGRN